MAADGLKSIHSVMKFNHMPIVLVQLLVGHIS
jgi:hypothetical protein